MEKISNPRPGEILLEEFLKPLSISLEKLAAETFIPVVTIEGIITGSIKLEADIALRLSQYFGNSPKFWLGIQDDFDLEEQRTLMGKELKTIKPRQKSTV
ncbi:MAG TPA: HigA family addiction module antitoxin [Saprospiraceae bacterium]|nr:HigA family addiction module antitoxin [Saprospiraceae bacterium]